MEEEKITDNEQTVETLSKEEILERSRKENAKVGDEREQKLLNYGIYAMLFTGAAVLLAVYMVNAIILKRNSNELISIFFAMGGVNFVWQGIFGKKWKKVFLSVGIGELIVSVACLVMWVLTLVA